MKDFDQKRNALLREFEQYSDFVRGSNQQRLRQMQ